MPEQEEEISPAEEQLATEETPEPSNTEQEPAVKTEQDQGEAEEKKSSTQ